MIDYRLSGRLLQLVATAMWLASFPAGMLLGGSSVVGMLFYLSILPIAGIMHYLGGRLCKLSADEERQRDPRPHVLVLRTFERDRQIIRRPFLWLQMLLSLPWNAIKLFPKLTYEEALSNILRRIGPTIAMGHPMKPLEPAGASLMYAGDDWKEKISEAAAGAALVVIIADNTPSLRWEIQEVAKRPGLGRILLVLPPERDGDWPIRSLAWYRSWNELRRDMDFLPEAYDIAAAFWFDARGKWQPIEARSANAPDQLRALDNALREIPGIRTAFPAVSSLGWAVRRGIFYWIWLLAFPVCAATLLSHGIAALSRGGMSPSPNPIVYYLLIAAFSWIVRERLPLAKKAWIGIDVHPVRTYAPHLRIFRIWIASMGTGVILAFALRSFVTEAFKIPSGSMIPTLMIGDYILFEKLTYGQFIPWTDTRLSSNLPPPRGDVMVFKFPENKEQAFIKRVIAIPGDTLEAINGRPIINGWLVPHCYVGPVKYENHAAELYIEFLEDKSYFTLFEKNPDDQCDNGDECNAAGLACKRGICGRHEGPFKVAQKEAWVMGDNRDNSHDSRSWHNGMGGGVPFENIKGRAMFVCTSFGPGNLIAQDRLFVSVHGLPKLPEAQEAVLQAGVDKCMRARPPLSQTTPPMPRQ